jgi:hypothetical protein
MKENEQEHRDEAARLAQASREDQRTLIAWLEDIADDANVGEADRTAARERAHALRRLLKLPSGATKKVKQKP